MHSINGGERLVVYTADGLFEIPTLYAGEGLGLIGRRPYQTIGFGGEGGKSGFNERSVFHKAFRPDHTFSSLVMAKRVLRGGVLPLVNDVTVTEECLKDPCMARWKDVRDENWDRWNRGPTKREVLWCVEMHIDPQNFGFERYLGGGFLLVVPQTTGLEMAFQQARSEIEANWDTNDVYPLIISAMLGGLKHTTSVFDPVQWPLALPVKDLNYTEALFAMSLRPAPMVPELPLQPHPGLQVIASMKSGPALSSMASVGGELMSLARPLFLQTQPCTRPSLPDDIMDHIFEEAAHRGLAGNTLWDWRSHLALRLVSVQARDIVTRVSTNIVSTLRVGIGAMTKLGSRASWPTVCALRETALGANLHPLEVVMHGNCIDKWTIARIRRGRGSAAVPPCK